ncbi:MAG: hypothetical protein JWP15_2600 [Alphaproteobacteria bacterium]|nr:hypothetical protein [Alphaproteobacteria bacterium]
MKALKLRVSRATTGSVPVAIGPARPSLAANIWLGMPPDSTVRQASIPTAFAL